MILAGDIGGTKTLLGLFERATDRPRPVAVQAFPTLEYTSLVDIVRAFLGHAPDVKLEAACFGVAGPVLDQTARLTNVPWGVDASDVGERLKVDRLRLLNDLQAMAQAVPVLRGAELAILQEGVPAADGNAALIAAGTGLGQAWLHNLNGRLIPSPSEGGHADFAARTPREIELLAQLTRAYGRAEWEHVLSGPGLINLHRFVHRTGCAAAIDWRDVARAPALISVAALERRCERCVEALEMFVAAYGSEAGNLALRCVATAGVYLGGGIAPKILPALKTEVFLEAFRSKGPMTELLASIPISVILEDRAGLLGAAVYAAAL